MAVEFFAAFSRFEFALKRGGFLSGEIGGKAGPDWNRFADALEPGFFADMQGRLFGYKAFLGHRRRTGDFDFKHRPEAISLRPDA